MVAVLSGELKISYPMAGGRWHMARGRWYVGRAKRPRDGGKENPWRRMSIYRIASGESLEARGGNKGAIEKYLQVAHFVRMFESHNNNPIFLDMIMPDLYRRLAAIYGKTGDAPQSAYFSDFARTAENELQQRSLQWSSEIENRRSIFGVTPWNALVVEISAGS